MGPLKYLLNKNNYNNIIQVYEDSLFDLIEKKYQPIYFIF